MLDSGEIPIISQGEWYPLFQDYSQRPIHNLAHLGEYRTFELEVEGMGLQSLFTVKKRPVALHDLTNLSAYFDGQSLQVQDSQKVDQQATLNESGLVYLICKQSSELYRSNLSIGVQTSQGEALVSTLDNHWATPESEPQRLQGYAVIDSPFCFQRLLVGLLPFPKFK